MKRLFVTGSSGLVGSEVCFHFASLGWRIHGIDNNQRAVFFGNAGDTRWNQQRLMATINDFTHHELDIRNRQGVLDLMAELKPDAVVHAAAQPSHDRAAAIPFDDFDTNAVGTLNLLEAVRRSCPESAFVHMSTNKVYGDRPNTIPMRELTSRWDFDSPEYPDGIPESLGIDESKHSLFGASKVAADVMVQEYGRYFNMPTCCLRGGCLTGPNHSGVELHGFLSYLVKCNLEGAQYTVLGYKGKQVRDNIHSEDVARFIHAFVDSPKPAAVYNIGGGRKNSCSILEAFDLTAEITGRQQQFSYVAENRIGDHICYYSDLSRIESDYPEWNVQISLRDTISQIVEALRGRVKSRSGVQTDQRVTPQGKNDAAAR